MNLIVQESDQTINSQTTFQNTELTFAVAANEVFQFEGVLLYVTDTTPDIKFTAAGPTGAVGAFGMRHSTATSTPEVDVLALGSSAVYVSGGANSSMSQFWGAIHNGANAGNLTIQFAQNTSDAANTTVYAGSYLKWQQET